MTPPGPPERPGNTTHASCTPWRRGAWARPSNGPAAPGRTRLEGCWWSVFEVSCLLPQPVAERRHPAGPSRQGRLPWPTDHQSTPTGPGRMPGRWRCRPALPTLFSLDLLPPGRHVWPQRPQRPSPTLSKRRIRHTQPHATRTHPASVGGLCGDALVRSGVLVPSLEAGAGRPQLISAPGVGVARRRLKADGGREARSGHGDCRPSLKLLNVVPIVHVGARLKVIPRSSRAATLLCEATRTTTRQPSSSSAMACYTRVRGGRYGGDPSMACKRSTAGSGWEHRWQDEDTETAYRRYSVLDCRN